MDTKKRFSTPMIVGIVVLAIVIVGAVVFVGGSKEVVAPQGALSDSDVMMPTKNESVTSGEEKGVVKTFAISGKNFAFSQKEIRVKSGDTVRIEFTSTQGLHNLVVDEFSAQTERVNDGGGTVTVEFVADRVGTFEYYCGVGSHRALGMVGNLIVE